VSEPGRVVDDDIYVIAAKAGSTPKRLTDYPGQDGGLPAWSPDGKWIVFLRGEEPKYSAYSENKLAIVASDGSTPARVVSSSFDRWLRRSSAPTASRSTCSFPTTARSSWRASAWPTARWSASSPVSASYSRTR